jgi:Phosphatidate phosphatase APP1, catalytic domain
MSDESLFKKIKGKVTGKAGDLMETVSEGFESAGEALSGTVETIRRRLVGMEVTFYPTYGYREGGEWLVPVRAWVHDNRDTPFVEDFIEGRVRAHFARDIGRPLTEDEAKRLEACLENFIADDKNAEGVEFTFEGDEQVFRVPGLTSPNGVVEQTVRLPAEKVDALLARDPEAKGWLKVRARTTDGNGAGDGRILFLEPEGLSVVSDIDDTIKVTHVPAGKKTVLRNTFLKAFTEAEGMRDRYAKFAEEGNVSFHYVSGSPWQLFGLLESFLVGEKNFPAGTFHMKMVGKNILDPAGLDSIIKFVRGGDLATLDQKVRQITNLMMNLPGRKFILVGDSGEKDPEVFRAMKTLFPDRVREIYIRDVLGQRLEGMNLITGPDVPVSLDTSELIREMEQLVKSKAATAPAGEEVGEPKL